MIPQIYKVELLVMGDPLDRPQIIMQSSPDMTPEQWIAIGLQIQQDHANAHVNNVELPDPLNVPNEIDPNAH